MARCSCQVLPLGLLPREIGIRLSSWLWRAPHCRDCRALVSRSATLLSEKTQNPSCPTLTQADRLSTTPRAPLTTGGVRQHSHRTLQCYLAACVLQHLGTLGRKVHPACLKSTTVKNQTPIQHPAQAADPHPGGPATLHLAPAEHTARGRTRGAAKRGHRRTGTTCPPPPAHACWQEPQPITPPMHAGGSNSMRCPLPREA